MERVTETVKNETKEQKGGFLSMVLGNLLTGKDVLRAGYGNNKGKGVVRTGYGNQWKNKVDF